MTNYVVITLKHNQEFEIYVYDDWDNAYDKFNADNGIAMRLYIDGEEFGSTSYNHAVIDPGQIDPGQFVKTSKLVSELFTRYERHVKLRRIMITAGVFLALILTSVLLIGLFISYPGGFFTVVLYIAGICAVVLIILMLWSGASKIVDWGSEKLEELRSKQKDHNKRQ